MGWSAAAVIIAAAGSAVGYKGQREAAKSAEHVAERGAIYAKDSAALAEKQLAEQHALDISLAEEQLAFEEKIYLEATQYTTEQIAKRDAQVRAAAIAGYSASGIDPYAEDSSALSVLTRIEEESLSEQERVTKGYETFIEARELEMSQLKESTVKTFDWFMEQSKFELDYELTSRHAEASMYRKQAKYAKYGMYIGAPASGISAGYQTKLILQ